MKIRGYIMLIFLIFLTLVAAGFGMSILHNTYVPVWVPLAAALIPAAVTLPAFVPRWRKLTLLENKYIAAVAHVMVLGSVCFALVLGTNYFFASEPVAHEAVVVKKFRREHTRYRRGGRRTMIPAGKYHTWHVELELDDGHRTDVSVPLERYNKIRKGARRTVTLSRGLFGFTVVKNVKI